MDDKTKKLLNTKLRQPVHISYISKYILKETENETEVKLNSKLKEEYNKSLSLRENFEKEKEKIINECQFEFHSFIG